MTSSATFPSPSRGGWTSAAGGWTGGVAAAARRRFYALGLSAGGRDIPRTRVSAEMRQKARALRNQATRAETLLWYELRELKSEGIKFRRQSPIGPYIADFVCPSARRIVEVDGDFHESAKAKRHDANRDAYLQSLGYVVLRVDEPDVVHSAWHVAQFVKEKVALGAGDPTRPLRGHPPLEGEGKKEELP